MILAVGCDAGGPELELGPIVVETEPADGATDVPRSPVFRVVFDRLLAPSTVRRGRISVVSGAASLFLTTRYDPIRRELIAFLPSGRLLAPQLQYRLIVEDVEDLALQTGPSYEATFTTGDEEGDGVPEPPSATWAEVEPIFSGSCTGLDCHGPDVPAIGLDLSSAEAIRRTAIGVPAVQTAAGVLGNALADPVNGLFGIARIDVIGGAGRPASSYLLYKLLPGAPILGGRMPADGTLTESQIDTIMAWIFAGAPTEG